MAENAKVDPMVERALDNFGFAQVLVLIKASTGAAAARRTTRSSASKVTAHFLDSLPESVLGTAVASERGGRAASARTAARAASRPPAVREFPRLGVAVGYVDRNGTGALAHDASVAAVFHADPLSLIRPVRVAAARATTVQTWGLRRLGVDALWHQGLTGRGVRVGHLDTGVDGKHPALKKRIAGFMEFDLNGNRMPGSSPHDSAEHGTHTAGTICGGKASRTSIGVAPEADLFSGLVIEGGNALLRVLEGMEWILEQEVRVLSMSLGFRGFTPFFQQVVQRLRDNGVLPVFAIGNEGPGTSRSPGNYAEALSVGAVDSLGKVASFSSSITFARPDEPNQPNVVAPGVDVISAKPGGGVQTMDGTSMATPHVAGVAALLLQAKPNASVQDIERAIQSTCDLLPNDSPLRTGFGMVNPRAALAALS